MKKQLLFTSILFMLFSCTTIIKDTAESLSKGIFQQNDIELMKEGAPAFLLLIESLIYSNPESKDMLVTGIQLFSSYSASFVKNEERKQIFNNKTNNWAKSLLNTYPKYRAYSNADFTEKEKKENLFDIFIKSIGKKDIPYVFWAAYSLGMTSIANQDDVEGLMMLPIIKAIINKVYQLDDTYYYGAPHIFYGILYGAYPKGFGGDPEKAKAEFEKAIEISEGSLLMTKIMFANFYYKQQYDKENYIKTLQEVVDFDVNLYPDSRFANILSQREARLLLENSDSVFESNFDDFDF